MCWSASKMWFATMPRGGITCRAVAVCAQHVRSMCVSCANRRGSQGDSGRDCLRRGRRWRETRSGTRRTRSRPVRGSVRWSGVALEPTAHMRCREWARSGGKRRHRPPGSERSAWRGCQGRRGAQGAAPDDSGSETVATLTSASCPSPARTKSLRSASLPRAASGSPTRALSPCRRTVPSARQSPCSAVLRGSGSAPPIADR